MAMFLPMFFKVLVQSFLLTNWLVNLFGQETILTSFRGDILLKLGILAKIKMLR